MPENLTKNIYLMGFMGCGKTAVARELSTLLCRKTVEIDDEIERQEKTTISNIFATRGEAAFRDIESAVTAATANVGGRIISCGGGVVMRERNIPAMRKGGAVVFLKTTFDGCASRISPAEKAKRPLWQDIPAAKKLFNKRAKLYKAAADVVVTTDNKTPAEIAKEIISKMALLPDRTFTASLGGESCEVTVTADAPTRLATLIKSGKKVVLLTDTNVEKYHIARYRKALGKCHEITCRPGESIKTMANAKKVYRQLLEWGINRDDVLVAVGGGTVTDFGAYIADTFKRGMGFVLVSTTLLGCVDAAVGGKAALNLDKTKNIIGTFTVPDAVLLDIASFSTLPNKRVREGLVEAYKTGLIYNAPLAKFIEKNIDALLSGDIALLGYVAGESAATKGRVVSQDFKESALRAILNFGHTFGHAVEGWWNYKVSHGDAVAAGMLVALEISKSRGLLKDAAADKAAETIEMIVPKIPALPTTRAAMDIMKNDKKIRQGKLVFVLLAGCGKTKIVNDIKTTEITKALRKLEKRGVEIKR